MEKMTYFSLQDRRKLYQIIILSAVKFPGSPEASVLQQQPLMPPLSDDLSAVEGEDLRLQSYLKECPPNTAATDFGGQPLQGKLILQDTHARAQDNHKCKCSIPDLISGIKNLGCRCYRS